MQHFKGYNKPEWFCEGKEPFDTHELADEVARRMRKKHRGNKIAYLCSQCGKHHIGEAPPKVQKPKHKVKRKKLRFFDE